jgi:broad specificity phosphatase PhoE
MTTLLLVRHGETDWNAERRWQGHADVPLNERGRDQAERLAEELENARVDAVYSSDLSRARETAEIVGARLGVPVVLDPALREIDVGSREGLTWPET